MLTRLRLRHRLMILAALVACGFAAILVMTRLGRAENERIVAHIQTVCFPSLEAFRDMDRTLDEIRDGLDEAVASFDATSLRAVDTRRDGFLAALERARTVGAMTPTASRRVEQLFGDYFAAATATTSRMLGGELGEEVLASQQQASSAYDRLRSELDGIQAAGREETEAAFATARANDRRSGAVFGLITLVAFAFMVATAGLFWALEKSITGRLERATGLAGRLATGDLTQRLNATGEDEVGAMGRALNEAIERMGAAIQTIASSSALLGRSVGKLNGVSRALAADSEATTDQASEASAFARSVQHDLASAATGVEQLTAGIREIAGNATATASDANGAVNDTEEIRSAVERLAHGSSEIGNVIKLIENIAKQTNLLALNATIEASRAGVAGRGFAVVANEVKALAAQTASATQAVSERISAIQRDIGQAVEGIRRISEVIARISQAQAAIAAAVEEQSAVANDISVSVTHAADGGSQIVDAISSVADVARRTSAGASAARSAADDLTRMAADLTRLVEGFRHDEDLSFLTDGDLDSSSERVPLLIS